MSRCQEHHHARSPGTHVGRWGRVLHPLQSKVDVKANSSSTRLASHAGKAMLAVLSRLLVGRKQLPAPYSARTHIHAMRRGIHA